MEPITIETLLGISNLKTVNTFFSAVMFDHSFIGWMGLLSMGWRPETVQCYHKGASQNICSWINLWFQVPTEISTEVQWHHCGVDITWLTYLIGFLLYPQKTSLIDHSTLTYWTPVPPENPPQPRVLGSYCQLIEGSTGDQTYFLCPTKYKGTNEKRGLERKVEKVTGTSNDNLLF